MTTSLAVGGIRSFMSCTISTISLRPSHLPQILFCKEHGTRSIHGEDEEDFWLLCAAKEKSRKIPMK